MTALRPIEPISVAGLTPRTPSSGTPIFEHVDPRTLFVDPAYQRNLSDRSFRQIRRIVEGFDWTRFKPPVCAFSEAADGRPILKVIDGQHTAIAAASNPFVATIPIMIVEAPDTKSQASAFIGQNTDRLGVTATQMHVAAVAAGVDEAVVLERVCAAAGIRIRRVPPSRGVYDVNDTVAVSAIAALLKKEGEAHAGMVLGILAASQLAPIKADHMKAVDLLLTDAQYGTLDMDALPGLVQAREAEMMREAKAFGLTHCVPLWKALAAVWFKAGKKRRSVAGSAASSTGLRGSPGDTLADDLARGMRPARAGWASGNHVCRCDACDRRFRGARSAKTCARCAYGGAR